MYIILRFYGARQNYACPMWKVVLPCVFKTERAILGMARAFADRQLDGRVLRMDVYTGEQVQATETRLWCIAEAVGQSSQGCHTLVFKTATGERV